MGTLYENNDGSKSYLIKRKQIHTISRYSNLSEYAIDKALKENVYNNKQNWQKFLRLFFFSLGIGFSVSGIVLFFAYNWAGLNKFAKIGLIEGLIISTIIATQFSKVNIKIKDIILTGASILVGVLFAVYGQIYQTGANAYDFFLGWTVFITIWVLISNFAPLWLLYLILINTTLVLYSQQIANNWSEVFISTLLLLVNSIALIFTIYFGKERVPNWYIYTITLFSAAAANIGIIIGIYDNEQTYLLILIAIASCFFVLGVWHGLKVKSIFYLSVISFSVIIIFSTLIFKISNGALFLLLISLFIISSITFTIKLLYILQKTWLNGK